MKKVLIFSLAYYPLVGGAEVAIKEITDRVKDIEFDMVTLGFKRGMPKFEKIGNINVFRVCGGKLFFPIFAFLKARQLHKKNKYDAIWAMMAAYAGFAALFFKLTQPKVPYLLTLQEGDPIDYIKKKVRFIYPLFKMIFTKADFIQAISNYLANWAKDMGAKCPIEVVPNGVDIEKFSIFNSQFSKNKDEKILITTSRLVKKNGIDDVIRAMQYLPENVKFKILGTGPDEEMLKKLAKELKVGNRVLFLGHIDHKEMPKYLHSADIFIRPSLSEGMGNSFIEAMAAGLPVIATPVGGIPDFLKDGETGLFCEVNNPKSIAEKVKILLDNQELRIKIITNAKEMVVKNYDWNLIAEKMREKVFGYVNL
jgi:hypothetical protein